MFPRIPFLITQAFRFAKPSLCLFCGPVSAFLFFTVSHADAFPDDPSDVAPSAQNPPPCDCEEEPNPLKWRDLFDGESLEGWKLVEKWDFKGHGEVKVEDEILHFGPGDPFTGLLFTGEDFPLVDYELIFEAKRTEGDDFFLGVVFPFGEDQISFVCGGWGGEVVGITSVDGEPAVENQTAQYVEFENDTWYKIRLRVTEENVSLWVDDEHLVDLDRDYHDFTIYWEQEPLLPFGFSSWNTGSAFRTIRVRELTPDEIKNEDDES